MASLLTTSTGVAALFLLDDPQASALPLPNRYAVDESRSSSKTSTLTIKDGWNSVTRCSARSGGWALKSWSTAPTILT
jgi:hypothetical protein